MGTGRFRGVGIEPEVGRCMFRVGGRAGCFGIQVVVYIPLC